MRRFRRGVNPYFSRQIAITSIIEKSQSGDIAVDLGVFIPIRDLGDDVANATKKWSVASFSFTTDYVQVEGQLPGIPLTAFEAEEAFYIDRVMSGGLFPPSTGSQDWTMTNELQNATASAVNDLWFPRRIVHRRMFFVEYGELLPASPGPAPRPTSFIIPGFGTERTVRRRIALQPQEGLYWRVSLRNVPVVDTTGVEARLLGVLTYRSVD